MSSNKTLNDKSWDERIDGGLSGTVLRSVQQVKWTICDTCHGKKLRNAA